MSREQYREYAYWFQGVEGENCDTTKTNWQPTYLPQQRSKLKLNSLYKVITWVVKKSVKVQ